MSSNQGYKAYYKYIPLIFLVSGVIMFVNLSAGMLLLLAVVFFGAFIYRANMIRKKEIQRKNAKSLKSLKDLDLNEDSEWIKNNLRGHNKLIDKIIKKVGNKIRLSHPNRPLGSYMFIGPTGTGKTFLATLLSQCIYKEEPLVFHMVNYTTPNDAQSFLDALVAGVNEDSARLILLDEIDKCSTEVLNVLYPILDQGMHYNNESKEETPFHSCLFIATSNHGALELEKIEDTSRTANKEYVLDLLSRSGKFQKSFLARWDDFFHMPSLDSKSTAEVACLEFTKYWHKFDITVDFIDPDLIIETLTRNEPFKEYGVRELSRVIQERMDSAIIQVKDKGASRVKIYVNEQGKVKVKASRRAA
ncbi:MAG: ATP-dependent Clp protease ATP-binding subunit [Oligoflexia bacterium]|nr:ATP-dependent Clp protease ATP-binding subunit [Oligoflexia bacterium]